MTNKWQFTAKGNKDILLYCSVHPFRRTEWDNQIISCGISYNFVTNGSRVVKVCIGSIDFKVTFPYRVDMKGDTSSWIIGRFRSVSGSIDTVKVYEDVGQAFYWK